MRIFAVVIICLSHFAFAQTDIECAESALKEAAACEEAIQLHRYIASYSGQVFEEHEAGKKKCQQNLRNCEKLCNTALANANKRDTKLHSTINKNLQKCIDKIDASLAKAGEFTPPKKITAPSAE